MWDERYSAEEYADGTEPNTFLTANFQHLPKGRVLSLAEGEGAQRGVFGATGLCGDGRGRLGGGVGKGRSAVPRCVAQRPHWVHADLAHY
jgi:hypothetical protein